MPAAAPHPFAGVSTNAHPTILKPWHKLGPIGVIVAMAIFILAIMPKLQENFEKNASQTRNPNVQDSLNVGIIEKNEFYGMSSYAVCESAVTIDGLDWMSPRLGELLSTSNRPYYEHAKQIAIHRGYSLQFCAYQFYEYGGSVPVPTDARRPWSLNHDNIICEHALNSEKTGWRNSPARVEARIRRLALADCLQALYVPAPPVPAGPITPQAPSSAAQFEAAYKAREDALGLTRDQWRGVQAALQHLGFQPGPLDGLPGSGTRSALMNFQKKAFWFGTGYVDNDTLNRLREQSPAALGFEPPASAGATQLLTKPPVGVRPPPPPSAQMAYPGHSGWTVDTANGCWLWNPNPLANETVSWSGICPNGPAMGSGVQVWRSLRDGKPQSEQYVGTLVDGRSSGQGVQTWGGNHPLVGNSYEGAFSTQRNGRGIYSWADGRRYEGEFLGGRLNGRGTLTWPNGERYVGDFRDGRRTGQGIHTWPDGSRWHGEWLDGRKNGRGVYTRPNGVSEDGVWANDQLQ